MSTTTPTGLCLALHTDLSNIKVYAGNVALQAALILTAEEKVAAIIAYLIETRRDIGLAGSATIIEARAIGGNG